MVHASAISLQGRVRYKPRARVCAQSRHNFSMLLIFGSTFRISSTIPTWPVSVIVGVTLGGG